MAVLCRVAFMCTADVRSDTGDTGGDKRGSELNRAIGPPTCTGDSPITKASLKVVPVTLYHGGLPAV